MLEKTNKWQVLIVDDEELIHDNLKMNLRDMEYENKKIDFIHCHSAGEASKIMKNNHDIAVIILDVMMEEDSAGLDFVKFVRDEIKNDEVRILLHTGQPGIAPKKEVAEKYKIDAYLDKNIADNDDCYAAVKLALRSYKDRLNLKNSAAKSDVDLLKEIAANYVNLLKEADSLKYEEILLKVSSMVNSSQEILACYSLQDLKQNLPLGTTKSNRLSFDDYSALIQVHNLKIILTETLPDKYPKEKIIIFDIIKNAAKSLSSIKILPEFSRKELLDYQNIFN